MGVTIHYVDASMDGGRIIAQRAFAVQPQWSKEEIEAQVHAIEHVPVSYTHLFGIPYEKIVLSAHRTPDETIEYAKTAYDLSLIHI